MNLQTMTTQERERLAYAEGFTETANLLAQLDDALAEIEELNDRIEFLQDAINELEGGTWN